MRKRGEVYHVYEDLRRKVRDKIKWIYTVVSQYDDEIKIVQSDNGKEYEKMARIIVKYGTRSRFTQAYTPQQNGMAERHIRMVMEKALFLLFEGRINKLRTFGFATYAWIPRDKRNKLEVHAVTCILWVMTKRTALATGYYVSLTVKSSIHVM
ncbi:hypothetical protein PF005_g1510 [Phytophthora fragariae]|uniref:Integrase catalytic domain-containing protein n=1 Tax=Phytophthora fragariae TaxID=53985 RepID=A0A6A3UMW0_9STRA|nr:hypothetical protein PF003_g5403 [Phytophthora fragariae]KAE8949019.1 hypothetical protein PF009_g1432 [Phytophthora fragariae]KAE9138697.1 hypothetical protein PF007_g1301 [Phytophthora fragariae]KAE9152887.1 hypothetical protein PF006_g2929 [Phytophthora fragariae]KAE9235349.1 hypothetical protein PF005_g1510 [Phytophthora fragariae]